MNCSRCSTKYGIRYENPLQICYECPKCHFLEMTLKDYNYEDLTALV